MTTVVVAGALANKPRYGGEAWVRLSWARGLRELGADVHLVEQMDPDACVDANGSPAAVEDSVNLAFFRATVDRQGWEDRATLVADEERCFGRSIDDLRALAGDADLLVNISGHLRRADLFKAFRRTAYVDIDPGFTQLWHADGEPLGLENHDVHFTIGEGIGAPDCPIPTNGLSWIPTRQPVVLGDWPLTPPPPDPDRLTTVGSWRGAYGPVAGDGHSYGLKVHEWRNYLDLPGYVPQRLEIALDIHPDDHVDRRHLIDHGWKLVDPTVVADDPGRFRAFVQGSGGEFSVAQGVYVNTASGWFSDRTTRYLASGRPALVQDTGFSTYLPTGLGLVSFSTFAEAVQGARSIATHYPEHAAAAREIAERYFDAEVVLARFLDQAGVRA